ncbi:putative phosphate uptake ABC transporter permease protein [Sulfitobacter noctilucae]|uniref:phosphonate ABC transporter, permease protein PhnE n=1 Tax=Sulfitobacter noctilucae TaxID=1342302 RepID=UPI000469E4C9|nr:phosphonate ABC transporter, permease protein PhnE [Sulfitobacter noctilucae]KIN60079.1 putative phosphate uptake ABC transporter permease protein [Sulfitobacter noctilucae]
MADVSLSGASLGVDSIQSSYLAQVQRRRLYGGLTLLIFIVLMVSGFTIADDRNAGGFWNGLHQVGDYPTDVLSEAWEQRADLPGLVVKYFPALVETVNIAAVSTLIGAIGGLFLSLLGTRGLAKWPRLILLFRRLSDIMRAVPEIVVALVLIFVLGGGPVPAMIAIAIHTAGSLGKMFSEVSENADLKPLEGLESTGATWFKRMLIGILPQVAPNYVSYTLLRFEINIRASAILGFVGAGGLGYELRNAMAWGPGRFDEAAAIFILLFGTIVFFDQVSSRYRNRLTEGQAQ